MDRLDFYRRLARPADTRILLMVVDGLGGLPSRSKGQTELEAAATPTFDALAAEGETGLITPVLAGVTPGSGPAHLALFGYDPTQVEVGRGVLAALGIGFDLQPGDVAARINFCTLDSEGRVTDRRAGRIESAAAAPLAERLDGLELDPTARCRVRHVKQYRACVIFQGEGLDGRVADTDPQRTGVEPHAPRPLDPAAERTATLAARFIEGASELLADEPTANGVLLRGFDGFRPVPGFADLYGLEARAVAAYPMYRGVARLVGMEVLEAGESAGDLAAAVARAADADFVYLHYKSTDSRGEDGDFDAKVAEIEAADALLAEVLAGQGFDVVVITGDHSTPSQMRSHSWHPVPLLLHSNVSRHAGHAAFGESGCATGSLGQLAAIDVMPLALAHAGRLTKFGA